MRFQRFALSCLFVLGAVARPPKSQSVFRAADGSACPSGVHIIGVRGTLEKTGFGAMQNITDKLKQKLSAVDAYAIDYPASGIAIGDDGEPNPDLREYSASEAQGYAALKTHLEDYSTLCPDTKVVLMGYSQGAHVVGDVLCGAYGLVFPRKKPVDEDTKSNIRAIIQLGDPTNVRRISWHAGNSTGRGLFPRAYLGNCKGLANEWRSYCDAHDLFCDRPGKSIEVHLGYVARYLDDIVDFVVEKVEAAQANS